MFGELRGIEPALFGLKVRGPRPIRRFRYCNCMAIRPFPGYVFDATVLPEDLHAFQPFLESESGFEPDGMFMASPITHLIDSCCHQTAYPTNSGAL